MAKRRIRHFLARLLCCPALALAAGAAHAGTVLETINRDLGGRGGTTEITTYAQGGRMRVDIEPGDTFTIFRDDTIYSVNNRSKSYFAMDRAAMKRMADQVNPALKQLEEQIAKMPPEQRAQVEQKMGMRIGNKAGTREVRKTGRADKIGGYACTYVELHEDGALADEFCVAPAGALAGSDELLRAATKLSALIKEMLGSIDAPWLKDTIGRQSMLYEQIGGVPLLSRHYAGGKPVSETTIKSIRTESLAADLFDLPAGYFKKDMMMQR